MRLVAVVSCLLLAIPARPANVDACSCIGVTVRGLPDNDAAPTNTHVYLWVPVNYGRGRSPAPRHRFVLREASDTGKQDVVPTTRRDFAMGSLEMIELAPVRPLKPKTHYAVIDDDKESVLEFTTTTAADTTAPSWTGIRRAGHYADHVVCCMCRTGSPYVEVELDKPTDDGMKGDAFLYEVWIADAAGRIDYAQPPTMVVRGYPDFYLGHPSIRSPPNFAFPRQSSLELGVRAIDLAGNASWSSEVRFAIGKTPILRKH